MKTLEETTVDKFEEEYLEDNIRCTHTKILGKKNYLKMFRLMTAKGRIENEQKSREIENLFAEPECDEVTIFGENTGEIIQGRKYRGEKF